MLDLRHMVGLGVLIATSAAAHDPAHPELNGWFDGLKSGNGLCCSFVEAATVADPDWESRNGHYRVRVPRWSDASDEMIWVDVPDEAVITEPNRIGRTMVWPYRMDGMVTIRCFMPGTMM